MYKEGYCEVKQDVLAETHYKETITNCLAHIVIRRQGNGKYQVIDVEEKHNNPFALKPCTYVFSQMKITK